MDILEHQPVNKLCVQAGKSPMETKWFSVAAGSHPNLPQTLVNEWHQMFKSRRTAIFDDEWAPIQPGSCTFVFLKQKQTEILDLLHVTEDIIRNLEKSWYKDMFYKNSLKKDMKSVELKGVYFKKRVTSSSCLTSPDVVEIWNSAP